MSLSYGEATEAMDQILIDWLGNSPPSDTYWERKLFRDDETPDAKTGKGKITLPRYQHTIGGQATLGQDPLYEYGGIFTIIINGPAPLLTDSLGATEARRLGYDVAQSISDAYQGQSRNTLWFRDVRVNEQSSLGAYGPNVENVFVRGGKFSVTGEFNYHYQKGTEPFNPWSLSIEHEQAP